MKKAIIISFSLAAGFLLGSSSTYLYLKKVNVNLAAHSQISSQPKSYNDAPINHKQKLPKINYTQAQAIASFKKLYTSAKISSISLAISHDHYVYEINGFDKNKDCTIKIDATNGKIISQATTRYEYFDGELTAIDLNKTISQAEASQIAKRRTHHHQAISWQLTQNSKYDFPIWKVTTLENNNSSTTIINALNSEIIE